MELQKYWQEFRKQGLGFCAISYDSVAILDDFAQRHGITLTMLSDPESKIIKSFGILNTEGEPGPDNWHYGVPRASSVMIRSRSSLISASAKGSGFPCLRTLNPRSLLISAF